MAEQPAAGRRDRAREGSRSEPQEGFRSGFVALVGRPNAGKSTLLNRLIGEKVAIVSPRPQTTRNRITGIKNLRRAQIVFVDTPGVNAAGGRLGEFMARTVERALEDVDAVCVLVDATTTHHPDSELLAMLRGSAAAAFCCLNKADLVKPKARLLSLLETWRDAHAFRELLPISAIDGTNCDRLVDLIVATLPVQPAYFPSDTMTDQPETFYVAEVIRERIFNRTHEEIPYASAVRVEELVERMRPRCLYVRAVIFVERTSQKAIVIGRGGSLLKQIGVEARRQLEEFFGIKVFLDLSVSVRPKWRKDARALREFGFLLTS